MKKNLLSDLPRDLSREVSEMLLQSSGVRVERIVSLGHSSPDAGWYDQEESEWVMVLEGAGMLLFDNGRKVNMQKGDSITIPAHVRHKVVWTDPDRPTIWLAVFYR